ncbi:DUF817 domain-containing protein [soil metagenome]
MKRFADLLHFGTQQALCCIFPASIFIILGVTKLMTIPYLPRYDVILIACLVVQFIMVKSKLETYDELKVISLFHVIGLCLEWYKIKMGSWSYPEPALSKIAGVPLYSGFMYASVASYICQAWKRLSLRFINWPSEKMSYGLGIFIYANFFTHHFVPDFRWLIIVLIFYAFRKAWVAFTVNAHPISNFILQFAFPQKNKLALVPIYSPPYKKISTRHTAVKQYRIPLIAGFILIGFFIWLAENISTYFGAWQYPDQHLHWKMVHISKISSWFLLVIISIILVAGLKKIKYGTAFFAEEK